MSPSPATGLSKGEREREINSTSFGECKTVPGMYLCPMVFCSGLIAALWWGPSSPRQCGRLAVEVQGTCLAAYCLVVVGTSPSCFHSEPALWAAALTPSILSSSPNTKLLTTFVRLSKQFGLGTRLASFTPLGCVHVYIMSRC